MAGRHTAPLHSQRRKAVTPTNSLSEAADATARQPQGLDMSRRASLLSLTGAGLLASGLISAPPAIAAETSRPTAGQGPYFSENDDPDVPTRPGDLAVATFAGGCFWCMEGPFDKIEGVVATTSGYTGGKTTNPTYESVSAGFTGHAESMEVLYDPTKVTYSQLLDVFWHQVNPTTPNQQFCDRGSQYRSAIFPASKGQMELAAKSLQAYQESGKFGNGKKLVTEISPLGPFWKAEEYHQDYYLKNPEIYRYYRTRCGRDDYLMQVWGDEAQVEERASVIPPPQLLLKYGAVLGGAWLGGGLLVRAIRASRSRK
eukprot:CAMPEP_0117651514 /NCGR_PEP_ID=MMETSP0804-20121206/2134_1 /TAXON_ID=1074897 /ORGANISM="Tetraselmis astigmatica, Strain CCMP880" /LENGTH=313 /DNA_ID=CAMNT_0005457499 /DNA_START=157 /DNA_END=1098 /DNA_ORIENTATION=-